MVGDMVFGFLYDTNIQTSQRIESFLDFCWHIFFVRTLRPISKTLPMKKFTTAFFCLAMVCSIIHAQSGFTTKLLFVAKLVGEQEAPPVITDGIGEASFSLNSNHDSLCINVTFKGLTSTPTGAHIHLGPVGGTGSIVIDLTNNMIGNRISAIITPPVLDELLISELLSESLYMNVHTANNPSGEIRGQIELEADWPFLATLDGNQETPPVVTPATGLASFELSRSMVALKIKAIFENLSGPITAIHLHTGPVGTGGPVVMDLMSGLTGNKLDIVVAPDSFLLDLMHGNIYINVHTGANPNGEIRGQILRQQFLSFDADMTGDQETPPIITAATGVGMISFNWARDTVKYNFRLEGMSGPVSAAHFHTGPAGTGGPVNFDLTPTVTGNSITGTIIGSNIPAGFLDACLLGNIYINVHTVANPNGEVRAQLRRFAREGFTYSIDALQETTGSTSTAVGSGMASIDRDADDLHFRMIVTGLTDTIQAAHFHNAPAGSPGLTIFDLTPFFSHTSVDDGAFNYWKKIDGFDSSKIVLFLNNSVYVNVHTALYPNGEVRGQVIQGGVCNELNVGIIPVIPLSLDFNIFPNPSSDHLNISFDGLISGNGILSISDMTGREIQTENISISKGKNSFSLPLSMQNGAYIARLWIEQQEQYSTILLKAE